jgi:uncharacterized protein
MSQLFKRTRTGRNKDFSTMKLTSSSFEANIVKQLAELNQSKRLIFMATCCERLLPNFVKFHIETGEGDPAVLRRCLDHVWKWLSHPKFLPEIDKLTEEADSQAPLMIGPSSNFTSAALDAANAIAITIETFDKPNLENASAVSTLSRDSVYMYIQLTVANLTNEPHLDDMIYSHPLMHQEYESQVKTLSLLQNISVDQKNFKELLLSSISGIGQGSLELTAV